MMHRQLFVALGLAALSLSACHRSSDKGTTISFNATDTNGNVTATADGATGQVALDIPGFSGKLTLPKIKLDGDDFDMNGVHLYPGTKIGTMNIAAGNGHDGNVHIGFESPADPATVHDWLSPRLAKAGYALTSHGTDLIGKTDDGKPVSILLSPASAGHTDGIIKMGG